MEVTFVAEAGKQVDGHNLAVFLNTADSGAPKWSPLGLGVESADLELDWQKEDKKDIWGNTNSSMKTPIITQSLDPWPVKGKDAAMEYLLKLAIVEQDAATLCALDILIVHKYIKSSSGFFAERYPASSIDVSKLSREGGGFLQAGTSMTCGGTRAIGTATVTGDDVAFTAGT